MLEGLASNNPLGCLQYQLYMLFMGWEGKKFAQVLVHSPKGKVKGRTQGQAVFLSLLGVT